MPANHPDSPAAAPRPDSPGERRPHEGIARQSAFIFSLAMLALYLGGYVAFRTDHVTQVPMFLKLLNPELYPRDWFLNSIGHYPVRKVFLAICMGIYKVLPRVEWMLFSQFLVYLLAVMAAMRSLARHQGRGLLFLFIWIMTCTLANNFANLAKAPVIEFQTVPRMYPYAACMWAIPLMMDRRGLLAGLLLGLTGLVQGAPSSQFLIVGLPWLFTMFERREAFRQFILVLVGFLLTYSPQFILLGDVIAGKSTMTAAETIKYLAYIRHPHHMLPLHFSWSDYKDLFGLLLLLWAVVRRRRHEPQDQPLLNLIGVFIVFFVLAEVFIDVFPIAGWVAYQPMRQMAMLRYVLFFFIAQHVYRLLTSSRRQEVVRGLLFSAALFKSLEDGNILTVLVYLEALLLALQPRMAARAFERMELTLVLLGVLVWLPAGRTRMIALLILTLMLMLSDKPWRHIDSARRAVCAWNGWLPLGTATAALFLIVLLTWPFRAWAKDPAEWSRLERFQQNFTHKYQVYPYPYDALEFVAVWAKEHTPHDALFLLPPERAKSSFQYWSERSSVFNVKTFPYVKSEWPMWIDRYFNLRGLPDWQTNAIDRANIEHDAGGDGSDEDYEFMKPALLERIAIKYGADYVVTPSTRMAREMTPIAGPFYSMEFTREGRRKNALYVYEVK